MSKRLRKESFNWSYPQKKKSVLILEKIMALRKKSSTTFPAMLYGILVQRQAKLALQVRCLFGTWVLHF
jgi:hypothetical protein